MFCVKNGGVREVNSAEKRKRSATTNIKMWTQPSFMSDNYKKHHVKCHKEEWLAYMLMSDNQKANYFRDDESKTSNRSVVSFFETSNETLLIYVHKTIIALKLLFMIFVTT